MNRKHVGLAAVLFFPLVCGSVVAAAAPDKAFLDKYFNQPGWSGVDPRRAHELSAAIDTPVGKAVADTFDMERWERIRGASLRFFDPPRKYSHNYPMQYSPDYRGGIDCSGFTMMVLQAAGFARPGFPSYQGGQYRIAMTGDTKYMLPGYRLRLMGRGEPPQKGDLVFFKDTYRHRRAIDVVDGKRITHVGIISETGGPRPKMMHASSKKGEMVDVEMLDYHLQHLVGFARVEKAIRRD